MNDYSDYLYQVNGKVYTLKDIEKIAFKVIEEAEATEKGSK